MSRISLSALHTRSLTPYPAEEAAYIFSLAHTGTILAALTSFSTLHLLSPSTLQSTGSISTPASLLSSYTSDTLLTAGQSGQITLHDLRAPSSKPTVLSAAAPILSLTSSTTGLIAAGTELTSSTATVLVFDPRNGSAPLRTYGEAHNDDVTALSFSSDSSLLASGGTDGLVNIFSLAAPKGAQGEGDDEVEGALKSVLNHGSVHRCGFLPGGELWALSHHEVLALYGDAGEGETFALGDVRSTLECEYAVNLLPRGDGAWVVAGNKEGQWLDLRPVSKTGRWEEGGYRLVGGHGAEVCRDVLVDITVGLLAFLLLLVGKAEILTDVDKYDIHRR